LAYSELYFTDTLWPDFDDVALDTAIASYRQRERRFGRTSEQLQPAVRTTAGLSAVSPAPTFSTPLVGRAGTDVES
jgi:undecaprenyl diphosphate synthase